MTTITSRRDGHTKKQSTWAQPKRAGRGGEPRFPEESIRKGHSRKIDTVVELWRMKRSFLAEVMQRRGRAYAKVVKVQKCMQSEIRYLLIYKYQPYTFHFPLEIMFREPLASKVVRFTDQGEDTMSI